MMDALKERVDYSNIDFTIYKNDEETPSYKLSNIINDINRESIVNPKWSFSCNGGSGCYNPKTLETGDCPNSYTGDLLNNCEIVKGIVTLVKMANDDNASSNSFRKLTGDLKTDYNTFLDAEKSVLNFL